MTYDLEGMETQSMQGIESNRLNCPLLYSIALVLHGRASITVVCCAVARRGGGGRKRYLIEACASLPLPCWVGG